MSEPQNNTPTHLPPLEPIMGPAPRKVLIIKPSALGDVITAMVVLHGLRRSFGHSVQIDWLIDKNCSAAIAEEPQLDNIIIFHRKRYGQMLTKAAAAGEFRKFCRQLRTCGYDWVLDLQGLLRSGFLSWITKAPVRAGFANAREFGWLFYNRRLPADRTPLHTVDRNIALARFMGIDARSEDFKLSCPASARQWLNDFQKRCPEGYILAVPATRWQTKLYPQQNWRRVIEALARHLPVVLTAGPSETHLTAPLADIPGVIDLGGKTTIAQLIALVSAASCVISCDSAAMHMAAAMSRPQVTLIGPTNPLKTGPYQRMDSVLQTTLDCGGCLKKKCNRGGCMQAIAPQRVIEATLAKLTTKSGS